MSLSWTEQQVVDELAGALRSAAAYFAHRPGSAGAIRVALVREVGEDERRLIETLADAVRREAS